MLATKAFSAITFSRSWCFLCTDCRVARLFAASCAMGTGHSLQGQVTKKLHEIADAHGAPRECTFG